MLGETGPLYNRGAPVIFYLLTFSFPGWRPHLAFLDTAQANEMMALRWLHLIFGIIWIGLLYFFNLVLTPAMKKCDPQLRIKIYPQLMPGAMGWFRSSALVTVLVGMRYFSIHLAADAKLAGDRSLTGKWFGWWLLVWLAAYVFIYALQLPAKGILDSAWVRMIGISVVVVAASWLVLALNGGPNVSNAHLAISVGGGLGFIMLLNTWGVIWRVQKRLIAWARTSGEQGVPMPPEAERLMRWNYLTARTSFWLSFPMLFFMGAAGHYPFLSAIAR
ncbi:MAG: hypothetical protein AUF67_09430 [Acidobacteria bacterium 13_1_20CM_58_21]|nr:MAG: hypothetical protein AUF67_09430 [Acidobacteria bacterium 13_1_20CM_58_21]